MPSKELTPEEKLLAVIQQRRGPEAAEAQEPPTAATPAPTATVPPDAGGAPAVADIPAGMRSATSDPAAADPDSGKLRLASVSGSPPAADAPAATATAAEGTEGAGETAEAVPSAGAKNAPPARSTGPMTVAFVNRFLVLVVLVLLLFVLYSIASVKSDVARETAAQAAEVGSAPVTTPIVTRGPYPPVTNFIDAVAVRDIFRPGGAPQTGTNVVGKAGGELALKLVGVSIDSASAQESMAIIKSKTGTQTYFVKQGQTVGETGATLERIFPDHVIVKYQRQELELR
jgi:hypothetical protein